jgi:hypothetical protein
MTPREEYEHAQAVRQVTRSKNLLDTLSDDYLTNESIAVARARLEDWLDDERGRWVA